MPYHITPDGPQPCRATKRPCPYSEHYPDRTEANRAFEDKSSISLNVLSGTKQQRNPWLSELIIKQHPAKHLIMERFESLCNSTAIMELDRVTSEDISLAKDYLKTVLDGEIPETLPHEIQNDSIMATSLHSNLCEAGYYAKVTKDSMRSFADYIGPDGIVLDPMAGKGYLVKGLREAGVKAIAADDNSWSLSSGIEKLDALEAVSKYGDQITHVAIAWAPYESTIDHKILMLCRDKFPHITIINIGEPIGGCTGSRIFWDDAEEFFFDHYIHYATTGNVNDYVSLMK